MCCQTNSFGASVTPRGFDCLKKLLVEKQQQKVTGCKF
ncbi:hypothetical protein CWATWH0003_0485 [Crocosphaera watsonii WH 0003]|uniref:Uncharacterized protein n=2 Tax=Crocosphaera watsonii TaxID=263511 RepID=G5IYY6_CROWT|nr:hypothetical protein CWATWH0003_0485 [Crocosphaera watsonii WH 0003]CCQ58651.1 hypothetical protein CWATWH0005_3024 [Crocosphaera watsonii WH 0005]